MIFIIQLEEFVAFLRALHVVVWGNLEMVYLSSTSQGKSEAQSVYHRYC